MPTFVYNAAKEDLLDGNLVPTTDDLAIVMLMFGNTAYLDYDATILSGMTLAEHDGATATRESLVTVAMKSNITGASGYARIDAADTIFHNGTTGPGVGTAATVAVLLYRVEGAAAPDGADGSNVPIAYYDLGTFTTGSSSVTIQWADDGFLQVA